MIPKSTIEKAQPKFTSMIMYKTCGKSKCNRAFQIDADTQNLKWCPSCEYKIRNRNIAIAIIVFVCTLTLLIKILA